MAVVVHRPGLLTTVQDRGRWGHQHFGMPVAGAMDMASHRLANLLVGNGPSEASLEVTLAGPVLEFEEPTLFAVTGARFDLRLDGVEVPAHTSCLGLSGQTLSFGDRRAGARAYVAIAGGVDVPLVLGSRSTHLVSGVGGLGGRALRAGDRLAVGDRGARRLDEGTYRDAVTMLPDDGARVRVIVGPHTDRFGPDAVKAFFGTPYRVAPESDRMGYRLEGTPIATPEGGSSISAAVPIGAIQVPHGGLPILLMADHQTTGGYPRIGTVITADLPVVAQLKATDRVEFELSTPAEAVRELIAQERALMT